jgi:hypothetical protein
MTSESWKFLACLASWRETRRHQDAHGTFVRRPRFILPGSSSPCVASITRGTRNTTVNAMPSEDQAYAFIVRIHRELRDAPAKGADWRGEVVHVSTQKTAAFRGLENVGPAIGRLITEVEAGG